MKHRESAASACLHTQILLSAGAASLDRHTPAAAAAACESRGHSVLWMAVGLASAEETAAESMLPRSVVLEAEDPQRTVGGWDRGRGPTDPGPMPREMVL